MLIFVDMLIYYNQIVSTFSRPFPSQVWLDVCRTLDELGDLEQCAAPWGTHLGLTWDSPGDGGYKTHGKPMENIQKPMENHHFYYGKHMENHHGTI